MPGKSASVPSKLNRPGAPLVLRGLEHRPPVPTAEKLYAPVKTRFTVAAVEARVAAGLVAAEGSVEVVGFADGDALAAVDELARTVDGAVAVGLDTAAGADAHAAMNPRHSRSVRGRVIPTRLTGWKPLGVRISPPRRIAAARAAL
jgi:hypothetical protein